MIKEEFFEKFPDPYLKGNKDENRPHYFCFKEECSGLLWVIPLSFRVDKYKGIIEKREKQGLPCDILHILNIGGRESVFLIQDMFPITEDYILREYTLAGVPVRLLDKSKIKPIRKKAMKILALIKQGKKFIPTQPDVMDIAKKLTE